MDLNYKKLELDKILKKLAGICSNDMSKAKALNIQPQKSREDVLRLLSQTSDAFELSIKYGAPSFYKFSDIREYLKRCKQGGKISADELLEVKKVLSQIQMIFEWHNRCEGETTSLDYLFSQIIPLSYLLNRLENSILEDGSIADSASPTLLSIRKKIAKAGITLRETLSKLVSNENTRKYLQDSNITLRDGRYVLPVKSEHRGKIPGLIHDTSATGQTVFIEPVAVVEANNDIRLLESKEQEEIEKILTDLCANVGQNSQVIETGFNACIDLCLIFAKAELGIRMKAYIPEVSEKKIINLKKARHPLLNPETAVPIDISLGESYRILIITGSNTGGKTVALKTCGLLNLMAMCGLMIPAAEGSIVSVFDNILCDIGDEQSIEENLSTFSSHMKDIASILEKADSNTLCLLDEPGTGTDPSEGAALSESIFEELRKRGTLCMATTHYRELKIYASATNSVENASVEFDEKTLKPTYRLLIGMPGRSNAFEICSGLGIPKYIIDYAKTLITSENTRFEDAIENLSKTQKELDKNLAEISAEHAETKRILEESEKEKAELSENYKNELERARQKADSIIEKTKADSNALIEELEKIKKEKDKSDFGEKLSNARRQTGSTLRRMYDTANPVVSDDNGDYKLPRPLKQGDRVFIVDMNREGIVAGTPDKDYVFVQAGIMKTRIKLDRLRLIEKKKSPKMGSMPKVKRQRAMGTRKNSDSNNTKTSRETSMEVDLRGMASDEGVYEMENYLDRAMRSGMHVVTVIHGKGTGVLRDACRRKLKSLPYVKSFRPGVYGEGEDGVTIVELK